MALTKGQNDFLGANSAIVVSNEKELEIYKDFSVEKNLLYMNMGGATITVQTEFFNKPTFPVAFYRNPTTAEIQISTDLEIVKGKYSLLSMSETFEEQINFFGTPGGPIMQKPSEDLIVKSETKEVSSELSLVEVLNQLEIDKVKPAEITENITQYKDQLIASINHYKGVVVTEENKDEIKTLVASLNNKKKFLNDNKIRVKKEATVKITEFENEIKEILLAFDEVAGPLKAAIQEFDEKEEQERKNNLLEMINPMLEAGIENGLFSKEVAEKIQISKSMYRKGAFTATGKLAKKTQEGINAELNRLMVLYKQEQADIETIKSSVKQLAEAKGLTSVPDYDKYVQLYKSGQGMPQIQAFITNDINMILRAAEHQAEKIVEEKATQVQDTPKETEGESDRGGTNPMVNIADDKTGEIIGKADDTRIAVKRETAEGKKPVYKYTYEFEGDFAAIKTFSNFLKILSKVAKFKYKNVEGK